MSDLGSVVDLRFTRTFRLRMHTALNVEGVLADDAGVYRWTSENEARESAERLRQQGRTFSIVADPTIVVDGSDGSLAIILNEHLGQSLVPPHALELASYGPVDALVKGFGRYGFAWNGVDLNEPQIMDVGENWTLDPYWEGGTSFSRAEGPGPLQWGGLTPRPGQNENFDEFVALWLEWKSKHGSH